MMAELLKGAAVAAAMTAELAARSAALAELGVTPTLAILRVGERADDLAYARAAEKRCEKAGVAVQSVTLPEDCTKAQLLAAIADINADAGIDGCLLLRPLPDRAAEAAACAALRPEKDVDGMTAASQSFVYSGAGVGFAPCTAEAVVALLEGSGVDLSGLRATVVGRSPVIGRPAAMLLLQKNATVTVCHTRTKDLAARCREAQLLVVAAGREGLIGAESLAPGQIVVDVGIHAGPDGALRGDVRFDEAEGVVKAITPVPGGVGAVTTAVLARHVIEAAERNAK